jgi:hypothetical protein
MNILNGKSALVYLDQNKWIDLSRAYYKRVDGEKYTQTLAKVQKAVAKNTAILPLSAAHIIETQKITDIDRRKRLAKVMVEISKGWTIAPESYIVPQEISYSISKMLDKEVSISMPKGSRVIGRGVPFAFGSSEEPHKHLGISDEMAVNFLTFLDDPMVLFELLVGNDESIVKKGIKGFTRNAASYAQEIERKRNLGKKYSKVIRKRAYIGDLLLRDQEIFIMVFAQFGLSFKDFLSKGKKHITSFFEQIPIYDVEIGLATERNEHWDKSIDPNDMTDIGFLSVAIPYCDIVITEKFWADLAKRKKLSDKYKTTILSELSDIENIIG